jgi:hypothetical protein
MPYVTRLLTGLSHSKLFLVIEFNKLIRWFFADFFFLQNFDQKFKILEKNSQFFWIAKYLQFPCLFSSFFLSSIFSFHWTCVLRVSWDYILDKINWNLHLSSYLDIMNLGFLCEGLTCTFLKINLYN